MIHATKLLMEAAGTSYDWERFLVSYPHDSICHLCGVDAFSVFQGITTILAFLVTRRS